ncbi:MAG: hypothetical protein PVJ75_14435 [Chloroflexota bacterium]
MAFLAAQLVWLSQPVLTLILSDQEVSGAAELLEDPDSVSALLALLDREPGDGGDSG